MRRTADMSPDARLGFVERFAYGIGDYASNLVYSTISAFLLVYYTNVVGANAAVAAAIIALSKVLDGISDLAMGYIVDHTKSRWGKARPWIARLCIPLAVCTVLAFSVPASLNGRAQIVYMFLTYNLVSTIFYTGINVPYATMNGLMTTNQYERGLLGNFRNLLATAGTMTVNTVVLRLTGFFGGGNSYTQRGWTLTIAALMAVFVILNLFMFACCKERVRDHSAEGGGSSVSLFKEFGSLLANRYWLLVVGASFCMFFMMSCFFGSALYFTKYNMGNEGHYALVSNLLSIAQIATLFITPFLMKCISKRWLFIAGSLISAVGFSLSALSSDYLVICFSSLIKGIGFGCAGATMYGCLQDAITYGEWYSGIACAGMGNAASTFCTKIGSGLGTAALGWVLSAGGFDARQAVQADSSLFAISIAFAWIPLATSLLSALCMLCFNLDKSYEQAVEDLAQGKTRMRE